MNTDYKFKAVIFDLDGVITKTALVHSIAWKEMFDNYLRQREQEYNEPFKEFTHEEDYLTFVDGKPRYEGVKSFLESRGISLAYGEPSDGVEQETYCGIGNRKNIVFNDILSRDGIEEYSSTVELIHKLKNEGIKVGVASSSKNCENVLKTIGLIDIVETRVDGVVSAQLGLNGKPAPDIFTTAADNLGVDYHEAVVIEDAISGVQAGRAGNFGLVLGLAREDNAAGLWAAGADIVVEDISEIGFDGIIEWFKNGIKEDSWSLNYRDYLPENERSREALLSVGNGYFGTRGAMCEQGINDVNYPGTYMAGLYNRLTSNVSGKEIENEDFVNISNWLPITFRIDDGDWIDINKTKIISIKRRLDFRNGLMTKEMLIEDKTGKQTQVYTRHFASMFNKHIAGLHYCLQAVNYSGKITFKSSIQGNHINDGVKRYAALNQNHLEAVSEIGESNVQSIIVKTSQSNIYICQLARLSVLYNGKSLDVDFNHTKKPAEIESIFSMEVAKGEYLGFQKTVWIEHSKKQQGVGEINSYVLRLGSFEVEMEKSFASWIKIWQEIDVKIEGDRLTQKMLRMHLYHLISGTSPHNADIDFGIPARGLTGEAYRGHIFWDELYILPVYFVHYPEIAKSVLMYRYRRLDEARKYAAEFNYKGAMFPWQSGSNGREETQKYHYNPLSGDWGDDHSSLQRHVSLAIAYNIIQYFHFTNDAEFIADAGVEMLIEIARFWESKCELNTETGRYSISEVMGPDEFHEAYPGSTEGGIKDNTYTNIMTVWMFNQIASIYNKLSNSIKSKLEEKLDFQAEELNVWGDISSKINLVISDEGILAQHDGYFDLKELDWEYYREKYGNIHRMDRVLKAEGKTPDDYKVAKQADTLMLYYNLNKDKVAELINKLGYNVPDNYVNSNLEYYLKRTSHGSTLSRVVHSYLAQQIGREKLSWSMFQDAVTSDYNDIQGGTTAEGIHTGVMAGTIWIVYAAFAGIDFSGEILNINPKLPKHWKKLSFALSFKSVLYHFKIENDRIETLTDKNTKIQIRGVEYIIEANKLFSVSI